jgi:hypothetical protein
MLSRFGCRIGFEDSQWHQFGFQLPPFPVGGQQLIEKAAWLLSPLFNEIIPAPAGNL